MIDVYTQPSGSWNAGASTGVTLYNNEYYGPHLISPGVGQDMPDPPFFGNDYDIGSSTVEFKLKPNSLEGALGWVWVRRNVERASSFATVLLTGIELREVSTSLAWYITAIQVIGVQDWGYLFSGKGFLTPVPVGEWHAWNFVFDFAHQNSADPSFINPRVFLYQDGVLAETLFTATTPGQAEGPNEGRLSSDPNAYITSFPAIPTPPDVPPYYRRDCIFYFMTSAIYAPPVRVDANIDEFRVWSYQRTSSEIANNVNSVYTSYDPQLTVRYGFDNFSQTGSIRDAEFFNKGEVIVDARHLPGLPNRNYNNDYYANYGIDEPSPNFTVIGTPVLSLPANGATGSVLIPTFEWSGGAGATSFRLQVSSSSVFASYAFNSGSIVGSPYTLEAVLANTTLYYWKVISQVGGADTTESSVFEFTTGNYLLFTLEPTTSPSSSIA